MRNNPRYVKYLIEEGRRGNLKGRFAHWAMAFAADTFFEEDREGAEKSTEGGSRRRVKGEKKRTERIRKSMGKKRPNELGPEQDVDPLLQRLLNGDWAAVGEMAEGVKKDEELLQEVVGMLRNLKEKTLSIRTVEEIKRDADSLQGAKVEMGELKDHAQSRDAMREAGMTFELFNMWGGRNENAK